MRRLAGLRGALLVALVAAAWSTGLPARPKIPKEIPPAETRARRSPAIYPPQRIPLRFFHGVHLETGSLTCLDCHRVAKSYRASDRHIPGHETCEKCHLVEHPAPAAPEAESEASSDAVEAMYDFYGAPPDEEEAAAAEPENDCSLCHPAWTEGHDEEIEPILLPAAHLNFPHKTHLDEGIGCATCHGVLDDADLATRQNLPKMAVCLTCHNAVVGEQGGCTTCHLTQRDGRLQQRFPTGVLQPGPSPLGIDHHPGWIRSHARAGRMAQATCNTCHTPQWCVDCHDGTFKPFSIHPADFVNTHQVAARQGAMQCMGCHWEQSFCVTCHERLGVGSQAPVGRVAGDPGSGPTFRLPPRETNLHFHPPGWKDDVVGPNHHAHQARRNITACVSCHREESCAVCHSTGIKARNPHLPGFACATMFAKNPRSCVKCHHEEVPPCP